jgi:MFS family permease
LADGAVSVVLPTYLLGLGLGGREVGSILTATMLGSSALILAVGLIADRTPRRKILLATCLLMVVTGLGFAAVTSYLALLAIAVVGTLNPSAGDVSLFLPTEQAALADSTPSERLTSAFALYNVAGGVGGALGALCGGLPSWLAKRQDWNVTAAERSVFLLYTLIAVLTAGLYLGLPRGMARSHSPRGPLSTSRSIVLRLTALFALDSFGGGFIVQSLLVLWLYQRYHLSVEAAGAIFFAGGLVSALSQFFSAFLARRIGRVSTMVFTHLPSNILLVLIPWIPDVRAAVACLLVRMALSQMDVPARQSYVMAMVPPEERGAAASITNIPRSLAAGIAPVLGGLMLDRSTFGWPLVMAGAIKAVYDLLLLILFVRVRPADEQAT